VKIAAITIPALAPDEGPESDVVEEYVEKGERLGRVEVLLGFWKLSRICITMFETSESVQIDLALLIYIELFRVVMVMEVP
jgi:hypothetical protein